MLEELENELSYVVGKITELQEDVERWKRIIVDLQENKIPAYVARKKSLQDKIGSVRRRQAQILEEKERKEIEAMINELVELKKCQKP